MREPSEREITLSILLDVTAGKEKSHILLREVLDKYAYLHPRTRARIKRTVIGVLEHLLLLDHIIDRYSKTPTKKMKPVILNILRIAVYEMKYMDGIPVRASVHEAVTLAQKKGFSALKGFVNGVLRSIAGDIDTLMPPEELSVRYSMPAWIVDQWKNTYGEEKTEEILQGFSGEAPLTVHICTGTFSEEEIRRFWEEEGISFSCAEGIPGAYVLQGVQRLSLLPSFQRGCFFVQDASSMRALSAIPVKEGMRVLDLCGAPGGKTLFLAQRLTGSSDFLCRDLTEKKVSLIEDNLRRCGLTNGRAQVHDALLLDEALIGTMDLVIADLPCSGLGVLSRKPEIRYRQSIESERELAALQQRMLAVAGQYVSGGGYLFYSTCTIDTMENEENVTRFLAEAPDFTLEKEEQLFPVSHRQDGFFYALMRKK